MTRPFRPSPISPNFLAIFLSLSLAACGGGSDAGSGSSASSNPPSGTTQTQSNGEALAPTAIPVQAADPAASGAAPTTSTVAETPPPAPVASTEPAWSIAAVTGLSASNQIKDMNDSDAIVGFTVDPNETGSPGRIPYQDPFLLNNGQLASLGNLGGSYGSANDINNAGQVAGYSYVGSAGQTHAFLYENGTMKDIGVFIGTGGSWAQAINETGQVAIYTNNGTYVYQNAGVRAIPGEHFLPAGMNDAGQIAGTLLTPGDAAFYNGTTLIDLAPLLPNIHSLATGVNNAGQVIGVSYGSAGNDYRAFLYGAGAMQALTVPDSIQSYATSINNAGDVVGSVQNADQTWWGFLYRDGQMIDLNSLPGIAGSGWVLTGASKINNAGQILAAGFLNGQSKYCVLTPPR
jgi:probable HAF family extracellular repeat protein